MSRTLLAPQGTHCEWNRPDEFRKHGGLGRTRSIVSALAPRLSDEMGALWGGVMGSGFFDRISQFKSRWTREGRARMAAVKAAVRAF